MKPPVNIGLDLTKLFENLGRVGGAALVIGIAAVVLAVAGLALGSNPILAALALTPAILLLPLSFWHFSRRGSERSGGQQPGVPAAQNMPPEISRYLEFFPQLKSEADLAGGYVRTSAESFMYLSRAIFDGLIPKSEIWATDRLILEEVRDEYWHHGGLTYLENNYRAVGRGIVIKRYFILSAEDVTSYGRILNCILTINAMCGVNVHVVHYEQLKQPQRREFAIFGPRFCDEVTYDIFGRGIIENRVHFRPERHAELSELMRSIAHLATPFRWDVPRAASFDEVAEFARRVRAELANEGPILVPVSMPLLLGGDTAG
jgi:hypothetical protein